MVFTRKNPKIHNELRFFLDFSVAGNHFASYIDRARSAVTHPVHDKFVLNWLLFSWSLAPLWSVASMVLEERIDQRSSDPLAALRSVVYDDEACRMSRAFHPSHRQFVFPVAVFSQH